MSLLSPREPLYGRARCTRTPTPKIYSIRFRIFKFELEMTYKVTVPRACSSAVKLIQSNRREAQHEYRAIQVTVTDSFGKIILDHDNTNIK